MLLIFFVIELLSRITCAISTPKVGSTVPQSLFEKWENTQVFIYHFSIFPKIVSKFKFPNPDCFGNLLTTEYILTATSCFWDVEKFVELLQSPMAYKIYKPYQNPNKINKEPEKLIDVLSIGKSIF